METKCILIVINTIAILCIMIGSILAYNASDRGVDEEQENKKDSSTLWFFASIVIGAFVLPIMFMKEARGVLANRDWGREFRAIVVGCCLHLCLVLLTSCSTPRSVIVERVVAKTDTLYKTNVRADTLRILDSVFVNQYTKGDTVYKEKTTWRWRDKVSIKTDTIYKIMLRDDTKQQLQTQKQGVTALKWYQRTIYHIGALCCIAAIIWMIFLYIKKRR